MIKLAATGLGAGYSPLVPGTVGTIVAIPLFIAFAQFSNIVHLGLTVAFSFFAIVIADRAEKIFQKKDDRRIVIDEIAGYLWTMFLVTPSAMHIVLGFILFRVFDIIKSNPSRFFERKLPGGYGVVMDDVVAGIYANIFLQVLVHYAHL